MLFAIVLVLTQALAIQAKGLKGVDALCSGKSIELTTVAQLEQFAAAAPTSSCPNYLKNAIAELATLIENSKDNLCSAEAADSLRAYYNRHLDEATIVIQNEDSLPKSLRKFVIAYGLQISNLCKKQMVKVLSKDARNLLDARDFEQLDELTNEKSALAEMLKIMGGPDEVLLPGDLAPIFNKDEEASPAPEKLYMQTTTASLIKKLTSVCQHRFKPVYGPLMIPLVRLSYMGFNYKDEPLKCNLKCSDTVRHVGQWSRIVFLCESLLSVHVVEVPDSKSLTEGTHNVAVKIISAEEAAAIEGARSGVDSDDSDASDNEVAHFDYKPQELIQLGDVVLDTTNKKFTQAVSSFKVGKSESELVKRAMVKKGKSLLKGYLKKGKVGVVVSAAYRGMTSKDSTSPGAMIVKSLDEIVADSGSEGAVSEFGDHMVYVGLVAMVLLVLAVIGVVIYAIVHAIMHG